MRRQSAHVDAQVLAELSAGVIDGKRATRIHAHLAGCQRCARRSAALTEISSLLASVPSPRMPDDVFTRLNTSLTQEAARRSGSVTVPDRSRDQDPETSVVDFSRAAKRRRHGLTSPVAARAFAAAAAACVVAAGGYAAVQLTTSGAPTASGLAAPKHHSGARIKGPSSSGPHVLPFIPHTGTGISNGPDNQLAFKVVDSGIDYQTTSLGSQIRTELNKVASSSGARILHKPTSQQYACVSDVTGGSVPALVDKARFQGHPATIIAMSHVGNQVGQAWVVGPSCSASATDILRHVSLSTSGG